MQGKYNFNNDVTFKQVLPVSQIMETREQDSSIQSKTLRKGELCQNCVPTYCACRQLYNII